MVCVFETLQANFCLGKSDDSPSFATILEAETLGLLEALKVAFLNGMHVVLFETVVFGFSNCCIWISKFYYLPKLLLG